MTELERLRVRVRELEEELAEWEKFGEMDRNERIHQWRRSLGVLPQVAHVAMILCESPGRFKNTDDLHDAIVASEESQSRHVVSVAISRLKKRLRARGITDAVHNEYGHGYMITPEGARQVRALVEG